MTIKVIIPAGINDIPIVKINTAWNPLKIILLFIFEIVYIFKFYRAFEIFVIF